MVFRLWYASDLEFYSFLQLERALTPIADGEIDIKFVIDRETTGNKRKRNTCMEGRAAQPRTPTLFGCCLGRSDPRLHDIVALCSPRWDDKDH